MKISNANSFLPLRNGLEKFPDFCIDLSRTSSQFFAGVLLFHSGDFARFLQNIAESVLPDFDRNPWKITETESHQIL